ncbi:hypothetical protein RB195_003820 [Necator americanus]|uniref:Uncharacterized protein n=1 Tax=Necator americanus TaxID=51031 RepID=A0ABR1DT18_NECAM
MACVAVHSHLLYGLLIIYMMIVLCLLSSQLYDVRPKKAPISNGTEKAAVDIESFKVLMSIIVHAICVVCLAVCLIASNVVSCTRFLPPVVVTTILVFTLIFNMAGCACLWLHNAPNFPGGYSRAIRAAALMSTVGIVYTLGVVVFFCVLPGTPKETVQSKSAEAMPHKEEKDKIKDKKDKKAPNRDAANKKKASKEGGTKASQSKPALSGSKENLPSQAKENVAAPPPQPAQEGSQDANKQQQASPEAKEEKQSADVQNPSAEPEGGEAADKMKGGVDSKEKDSSAMGKADEGKDTKAAAEAKDQPAAPN